MSNVTKMHIFFWLKWVRARSISSAVSFPLFIAHCRSSFGGSLACSMGSRSLFSFARVGSYLVQKCEWKNQPGPTSMFIFINFKQQKSKWTKNYDETHTHTLLPKPNGKIKIKRITETRWANSGPSLSFTLSLCRCVYIIMIFPIRSLVFCCVGCQLPEKPQQQQLLLKVTYEIFGLNSLLTDPVRWNDVVMLFDIELWKLSVRQSFEKSLFHSNVSISIWDCVDDWSFGWCGVM